MLFLVVGLYPNVTPLGSPTVEKVTVELKPCCMVKVTVWVETAPASMETALDEPTNVKLRTVTLIVAVRVRLPLTPVTTIG